MKLLQTVKKESEKAGLYLNLKNKPDRAGNDASTDADGKDDLHSRWDRCFTEWIV